MRNVTELPIETWVVREALTRFGVDSLKLNLQGNRGWPDRLFLLPERPFLVEFKRPGNEPDPLQAERLATLKILHYDVEVHDDRIQALAAIEARVDAYRTQFFSGRYPTGGLPPPR